MAVRRVRAFGIIDFMGLVAATGLTIAIYRFFYPPTDDWPVWRMQMTDWPSKVTFGTAIVYLTWPALLSSALLMVATACVPRPSTRRLLRRPGVVGCVSGLGATAAYLLASVVFPPLLMMQVTTWPSLPDGGVVLFQVCRAMMTGGFAVMGVWLVTAAGGRWRAERSWQDRAGRAVAIWWIAWAWVYAAVPHL